MNELQLGLVGAGAIIVIGVVVYNGFQGRRARRRLPRTMPQQEETGTAGADVYAGHDGHDEPPFIAPASPPAPTQRQAQRREPAVGGENAAVPTSSASTSTATPFVAADITDREAAPASAAFDGARAFAATKTAPAVDARGDVRREPTFGGVSDFSAPADLPADAAAAEWDAGAEPMLAEREARATAAARDDTSHDERGSDPAVGIDTDASKQGVEADIAASAASVAATAAAAQHAHDRPDHDQEDDSLSASAMAAAGRGGASNTVSNLPPVVVDRRIDCIVLLELGEPVAGDRVIPLAIGFRRAGSKPVYVEGLDEQGHWGALRVGQTYRALRAAVQLANRSGPLNELEFSEFVGGVHRLADALDAAAEFPEMNEIVQMARELDAFAAQCDAQLSVNVYSDSAPWSGSYVQAVASQDGLLLSRDGTRFVKLDAKQNPVFTLTFEGTNFLRDDLTYKGGHMITLLLDVPVADEDIMPWRLMCDYARSLGQRIGARVVDDQRRILPDASLQAIDDRLMTLYARLEQAGLPAGSPAARRLFSA